MSTARDETRDYFGMDDVEPSVSQVFGERAAFSFWPKVKNKIQDVLNVSAHLRHTSFYYKSENLCGFKGLFIVHCLKA